MVNVIGIFKQNQRQQYKDTKKGKKSTIQNKVSDGEKKN